MQKERETKEYLKYSDKWLIDRFFKFGSIDEAIWDRNISIPFSYMTYYRKLSEAGIIRSPGRQTSLTEALHFFRIKQLEPGMPLEAIYKDLPPSFKTSMNTLHRIYKNIEKIIPGRVATALVISTESNGDSVLVGNENYGNRLYGKVEGNLSVPMTFSHLKDTEEERVLRVMQQEVFTKDAVEGLFARKEYKDSLLSNVTGPFMRYRILDVEISCYKMVVPDMSMFSSYKLSGHRFVDASEVLFDESNYRLGVPDIIKNAYEYANMIYIPEVISPLNLALVE